MKTLLGIGVVGVACCAGLPLLAATLAGAGAGGLLGGAAGALALATAAGTAVLIVRRRRRTPCAPTRHIGEPYTRDGGGAVAGPDGGSWGDGDAPAGHGHAATP